MEERKRDAHQQSGGGDEQLERRTIQGRNARGAASETHRFTPNKFGFNEVNLEEKGKILYTSFN